MLHETAVQLRAVDRTLKWVGELYLKGRGLRQWAAGHSKPLCCYSRVIWRISTEKYLAPPPPLKGWQPQRNQGINTTLAIAQVARPI